MSLFLAAAEIDLLRRLNAHQVRYLVIGGHAVSFHGNPRPMKDLDLWIDSTAENAARVAGAVAELGFQLRSKEVERIGRPDAQLPLEPYYTELLTSCPRLDFDGASERATSAVESGVKCLVLGLADPHRSKEGVGQAARP